MSTWTIHHQDGSEQHIEGPEPCPYCDLCGGGGKTYCDYYQEGIDIAGRFLDGINTDMDDKIVRKVVRENGYCIDDIDWFAREYADLKKMDEADE